MRPVCCPRTSHLTLSPYTRDLENRFNVGSDEVFNKPLSKLAVHIKNTQDPEIVVVDEPEPIFTLNIAGAAAAVTNRSFKYSVSLLTDKHWDQLYTDQPSWAFFVINSRKTFSIMPWLNRMDRLRRRLLRPSANLCWRSPNSSPISRRASSESAICK